MKKCLSYDDPFLGFLWGVLGAALFSVSLAHAQSYPSKPIHLVLPFPPGGPTDLLGRTIGQKLAENVGQPVVVDNRPGAGGNLGVDWVAKSQPDGYTIVLSSPLIAISPWLYSKLSYDPMRDLAPIALTATIQNVLIVHPSVPAKNVSQMIALAKAHPQHLNYASGGTGTTSHLGLELLCSLTHIQMVHIPFKGTGVGMIGLLSGQADLLLIAAPIGATQIKAGKVRALAVLASQRTPVLPDVATAKEEGVDNLEMPIWYAIMAQAATPKDYISRLNSEIVKALNNKELKDKFMSAGIDATPSTPEQLLAFIKTESARYGKVIRQAGIKGE